MDYIALGRVIRHYRRQQDITQEAFAKKLGISPSFLGHIERGARKASIETLVNIAGTLHISMDALLADSLPTKDENTVDLHSAMLRLKSIIDGYVGGNHTQMSMPQMAMPQMAMPQMPVQTM